MTISRKTWRWLPLFACLLPSLAAQNFNATLAIDHPDGVYAAGETVSLDASFTKDGAPLPDGSKIEIKTMCDGKAPVSVIRAVKDGKLHFESSCEYPAWMRFHLMILKEDGTPAGKYPAAIGVMADPQKIFSAGECPADFEEFWRSGLEELEQVPVKVLVKKEWKFDPVKMKERAWLRDAVSKTYNYDVRISAPGPKCVAGGLSYPRKPGKYPAMLLLQGYGFNGGMADPLTAMRSNRILFSINAHGLEEGETWETARYLDANGKPLGQKYPWIGMDKRETWYFRYMFLRALRALEFLKGMPEWDGKNLIVQGASQGAAQALVCAALDSDVSLCMASIPAMCDFAGTESKPRRGNGWPYPYSYTPAGTLQGGQNRIPPRYYDMVNFAPLIRAEVFMNVGLVDDLVAPTGPAAVFNNLKNARAKTIEYCPSQGHTRNHTNAEKKMRLIPLDETTNTDKDAK